MIAVGTLGAPAIGTLQDHSLSRAVQAQAPDLYPKLAVTSQGLFGENQIVSQTKIDELPESEREKIRAIERDTKQSALSKIAVLPAIMCVCYLGLIAYFRTRGGYEAQVLTGHAADDEKFTGGVAGAMEG
jgi:hypothetical protein